MTFTQAIAALLTAIVEALKPYVPWLGGVVVGVRWQKSKQQETDIESYRQKERDRHEIAGLSDDALDRELRDPPK